MSNWQKFSAIITGKFTMNSIIMIFIVQHNCILSCKCKTKWGVGDWGGDRKLTLLSLPTVLKCVSKLEFDWLG